MGMLRIMSVVKQFSLFKTAKKLIWLLSRGLLMGFGGISLGSYSYLSSSTTLFGVYGS
jgi:hypothetical protein